MWMVALTLSLGTARAKTLTQVTKAKTLRVATEGTFPPFNFYRGKTLTGFEVELVEMLSADLGLKTDWKVAGFDTLLIGLSQDRFDLVASSHGITAERAKVVNFSSPHYCTGGVIVSKSDKVKTFASIKKRNVVVQVGTTYYTWLGKNGLYKAKTYPKDTDCLQNLLMGRADAWVTDRFVALDAIKANPDAKLVMGDTIFEEQIAMAVAKGNTELLNAVNDALEKIKTDGRYETLSRKYFAKNIGCK